MYILHGIHHMYIMLTLTPQICMLECTHIHIMAAKVILQNFILINHINFVNKNVWVPNNANSRGPKRKWVPKSPPLVFDIGVGSHMTGEIWYLGGGCR